MLHVSRRLARGVAARARSLAPVLGADADLLEAAAWLHDIGHAPGRRDRTARTRRRPLRAVEQVHGRAGRTA